MNGDIWIVCDQYENYDEEYILQMISKAKALCSFYDCKMKVFCYGKEKEFQYEKMQSYGVNDIILCDLNYQEYNCYTVSDFLEERVKEEAPRLIMIPNSDFGRSVAAFLSIRFAVGLTADCIDIIIDENGKMLYQRAAMSSTVIANIGTKNSLFDICTVKANVFTKKHVKNIKADIINYKYEPQKYSSSYLITDIIHRNNSNQIDFSNSDIIFGFGRGIKSKECYKLLLEVAKKYNAEIAGTRAVVEDGYIRVNRQVGQSGITIAPDIYIAFGISGASQHIVGIKQAKTIIAVNSDKNAAIFEYADYAVIEDAESILNEMLNR